jgi:hypothetical protein
LAKFKYIAGENLELGDYVKMNRLNGKVYRCKPEYGFPGIFTCPQKTEKDKYFWASCGWEINTETGKVEHFRRNSND